MSVRSRYAGKRKPPAKQCPAPKPKPAKQTVAQKTKAALNRLGRYMQKNLDDAQEHARRTGDTTFEQDMRGMVSRVGTKAAAHGQTERERVIATCRRDSDDEICRYFTNRPHPQPHYEFVVERPAAARAPARRRRKPAQQQIVERIILVER